jgi:hypothetical protein
LKTFSIQVEDMSFDFKAEPMQDTLALSLTIVNWVLCSSFQYPMIYLFVKRRDLPFFKQRGFWTTCMFVLAAMITHYAGLSLILFNAPCNTWTLIDLATAWMFTTSAERGFLLYVHYHIGVQAKDFVQNLSADKSDKGWILKHRSWFHHGLFSITKLAAFASAIVLAIPGWTHMASTPLEFSRAPFWSVECRSIAVEQLKLIGALLSFISVASLFGLLCLRNVQDNYFIKLELKIKTAAFIFFSGFIFFIITPVVYNNIQRPMLIVFTLEPFYGVASVSFLAMGMIVLLYERRQNSSSRSRGSSLNAVGSANVRAHSTSELSPNHANSKISYIKVLEMILENDSATQSFENFLLKELSVENLLFIQAIQKLERGGQSAEELIKQGNQIYSKFVSSDADLEVNISSVCRSSLEAVFRSSVDSTVSVFEPMMQAFKQSKNEVIHLIAEDSLRRFCRSSEFKTLGMSLIP